ATDLASTIDVVPTILSVLGMDVPDALPGINLLDAAALESRSTIYGEIFDHDIKSMDQPESSLQYRWVIDGRYKLIDPSMRMNGEVPELYDLIADPTETNDLAQTQPERVEMLMQALNDWWHPDNA
ncbi:MAG: sulfatase/phosphatase domain-containing protein, partial [Planctomycetota bacterium]